MRPAIAVDDPSPRPSRLVAEALVQRHGPQCIATRAARLGLPPQLTRAMVVACCATALDPKEAPRRLATATIRSSR